MGGLIDLSNQLDVKKCQCRAIIETPKGWRSKFDYDPDSDLFVLAGVLPEGMVFPVNFGFIPSTLDDDGDPIDIIVLMDEPAHMGCMTQVRIIGLIQAQQSDNKGEVVGKNRVVAVSTPSYVYETVETLSDLTNTAVSQIKEFFISYNRQRGLKFEVLGSGSPKAAVKFIQQGMKAHRARS